MAGVFTEEIAVVETVRNRVVKVSVLYKWCVFDASLLENGAQNELMPARQHSPRSDARRLELLDACFAHEMLHTRLRVIAVRGVRSCSGRGRKGKREAYRSQLPFPFAAKAFM